MLIELRIENYALIEKLNISFCAGLNVLSGETGAGKSIVIGAINLLLGERAAVEQVRQGQDLAIVEGIIDCRKIDGDELKKILFDAGIEDTEELIIAREVHRSGRSIARVNGRSVPVAFLKELGQNLVDLHGQHQHQSLLRPEQHRILLDLYGGEQLITLRKTISALYLRRQKLVKELSQYGVDPSERERMLDLYRFQLKEINDARLQKDEERELNAKEKILANAEKLCALIEDTFSALYGGDDYSLPEPIVDRTNHCYRKLNEAVQIDESLEPLLEMLDNIKTQLEELTISLRDYRSKMEYDPSSLETIQNRIALINNLKRKYGHSSEEILAFACQVENEINKLEDSEKTIAELEKNIIDIEEIMSRENKRLSIMRQEAGDKLSVELQNSFIKLALQTARIEVNITEKKEFTPSGVDNIEFLFSANRGEAVKPLSKIISGGEVSRVMLALKTVLAAQDRVPTLIFDEVDSGIGGVTIQAVAEKLAQLSFHHQVLCVTHSPQIAAMADNHYQLYKDTVRERTVTFAELLEPEIRRQELARMLDGSCTDQVSLDHVDNLLDRAKNYKEKISSKL